MRSGVLERSRLCLKSLALLGILIVEHSLSHLTKIYFHQTQEFLYALMIKLAFHTLVLNRAASEMADDEQACLLKLPAETMRLLPPIYLPYQSSLRLLATCRYLRELLNKDELLVLRYCDPFEVYKTEKRYLKMLESKDFYEEWRASEQVGRSWLLPGP